MPAGELDADRDSPARAQEAERAAADTTQPAAKNAASGIELLRLVEQRHKDTMPGEAISFAGLAMATPARAAVESKSEAV